MAEPTLLQINISDYEIREAREGFFRGFGALDAKRSISAGGLVIRAGTGVKVDPQASFSVLLRGRGPAVRGRMWRTTHRKKYFSGIRST